MQKFLVLLLLINGLSYAQNVGDGFPNFGVKDAEIPTQDFFGKKAVKVPGLGYKGPCADIKFQNEEIVKFMNEWHMEKLKRANIKVPKKPVFTTLKQVKNEIDYLANVNNIRKITKPENYVPPKMEGTCGTFEDIELAPYKNGEGKTADRKRLDDLMILLTGSYIYYLKANGIESLDNYAEEIKNKDPKKCQGFLVEDLPEYNQLIADFILNGGHGK